MKRLLLLVCVFASFALGPAARAECRKVGDVTSLGGKPNFLKIDPVIAARLLEIGITRSLIFSAMVETSVPETEGCWAGPAGDFDSQILSMGFAQWNFGMNSLQPLLKNWKAGFATPAAFLNARTVLMPVHGALIFSDGCLKTPISDACKTALLAQQDAAHKLDPVFEAEMTALFQTDLMLQMQTNAFVKLLDLVRLDLKRLFPTSPITPLKIKWAIDTKVQQGGFPGDKDILRIRQKIAMLPPAERKPKLKALVAWYRAQADSIDQDGIKWDIAWNTQAWNCVIDSGLVDAEQFELLHFTYLRGRVATGDSGRWQALTFQRRAKIVLGVGSIGGDTQGSCTPP